MLWTSGDENGHSFPLNPHMNARRIVFALLLSGFHQSAMLKAAPGDVDSGFAPQLPAGSILQGVVWDGRAILVSGSGGGSGMAASLRADGSLEHSVGYGHGFDFNTRYGAYWGCSAVSCLAVQRDGRFLVKASFTRMEGVSGATYNYQLIRLNFDGSFDRSFGASVRYFSCARELSNGKIVLGGTLDYYDSSGQQYLDRLNPDGTRDPTFQYQAVAPNGHVSIIEELPDGSLVIAGAFTSVGGVARAGIAKIRPDGTLDPGFNPVGGYPTTFILPQPDGKIITYRVGFLYYFTQVVQFVRLLPNGQLDGTFSASTDGLVKAAALQADGKIVIIGSFTRVGTAARSEIARLNANGTVDTSFSDGNSTALWSPNAVVLQPDGKVVVASSNNSEQVIERLANSTASESLVVTPPGRITWMRGGSAPEVDQVVLELSVDGGLSWTPLGQASPIAGGWEKSGLALPDSGQVRAVGHTIAYSENGPACGWTGQMTSYGGKTGVARIEVEHPVGTPVPDGGSLTFPDTALGLTSTMVFTVKNVGGADLRGITCSIDGTNASEFSVTHTPDDPLAAPFGIGAVEVAFAPAGSGTRRATLHIVSNDADHSPWDIDLSGVRLDPNVVIEIPQGTEASQGETRDFGTTVAGHAAPDIAVVVKNSGVVPLHVLSFTFAGTNPGDFSARPLSIYTPLDVQPGGSFTELITFNPYGSGPRSATLRITTDDPDESPFEIGVTGEGLPDATATIQSLVTNNGLYAPSFQMTETAYAMEVASTVTSLAVNVTPTNRAATFTVAGVAAQADVFSAPVPLVVGTTTIPILVTSQDGTVTMTYHLEVTRTPPAPGDVDSSVTGMADDYYDYDEHYNPGVRGLAVRPDGRVWIAGPQMMFNVASYQSWNSSLVRLAPNGEVEAPGWSAGSPRRPRTWGEIKCVAVQADGGTLIGGKPLQMNGGGEDFSSVTGSLVRLKADDSTDQAFIIDIQNAPSMDGVVNEIVVQRDGKILIGGEFTKVGGVARSNVARLNANGTLDFTWNTALASFSFCNMLLLPDGKLLLASNGELHRLYSNGVTDTTFQPAYSSSMNCMALQPDGKLLLGSGNQVIRLNADGSLDSSFGDPRVRGFLFFDRDVCGFALQADGKIVVTGEFSHQLFGYNGTENSMRLTAIVRLNTDGSLDPTFAPLVEKDHSVLDEHWLYDRNCVNGAVLQPDGKIWIGGNFLYVGGEHRLGFARLNNDPASQNLAVVSGSRVRWLRGGTAPEVQDVLFEVSTNGGSTWSSVGFADHIAGGWEKAGISLPDGGIVRARGRAYGGMGNGSSSLIEQTTSFSLTPAARARITSPANGSTLTSTTLALQWDTGNRVTRYALWVGSSPGGVDYYAGDEGTSLGRTLTVPADRKVYVTLYSLISGVWQPSYHVFDPVPSQKATLAGGLQDGGTLSGSLIDLSWTQGVGVSRFYIWLGSSYGGYDLGAFDLGTTTSRLVTVPQTGGPVYVTLWSLMNGAFQAEHYWFTTALPATGSRPARLLTPANAVALSSSTLDLTWDPGDGASGCALWAGSSPGGYDLYAALEGTNRARSIVVPGDGRRVYVTLYSLIGGAWKSLSYYFTTPILPDGGAAQVLSPATGSTLADATLPLLWSSAAGTSQYYLFVGGSPGAWDFYSGSQGLALSRTVTGLPLDGRPVYVTLYSWLNGAWKTSSTWFSAANTVTGNRRSSITSPANGSTLESPTTTFSWEPGVGVSNRALWIGSNPGGYDVWASGESATSTGRAVTVPADGRKIHVTLYSFVNGTWQAAAYFYSAPNIAVTKAAMISPAPGTTLNGTSTTFTWSASNTATAYALWVGRIPGGYNLYAGFEGLNLSHTVTNLPSDGTPVYVTLYSFIKGAWQSTASYYQSAGP